MLGLYLIYLFYVFFWRAERGEKQSGMNWVPCVSVWYNWNMEWICVKWFSCKFNERRWSSLREGNFNSNNRATRHVLHFSSFPVSKCSTFFVIPLDDSHHVDFEKPNKSRTAFNAINAPPFSNWSCFKNRPGSFYFSFVFCFLCQLKVVSCVGSFISTETWGRNKWYLSC